MFLPDGEEDAGGLPPVRDDDEVWRKQIREALRQYRKMVVCGSRSQIFRQMKQKSKGILCVLPEIFVKYAGKDASKTCASHLCGVALMISIWEEYKTS